MTKVALSGAGGIVGSILRKGLREQGFDLRAAGELETWLRDARRARVVARTARVLDGPFGASVLLPGAPPAGSGGDPRAVSTKPP